MILATVIGVCAAIALLFAGYIFGARRGHLVRKNLHEQLTYSQDEQKKISLDAEKKINALIEQKSDNDSIQGQLTHYQEELNKYSKDTEKKIDALIQQGDSLNRVVEPLTEWESQLKKLDSVVKVMQSSVGQKNKVAIELTKLKTNARHRSNLTRLMDEIIEKADFETVLLSDENGLPIAANSAIDDLERLAAISSFVLIFSDRFARDGAAAPISLLTHDKDNREMLCRIFYVGEQRFVLTAISVGLLLSSTALDPALTKVTDILSSGAE